MSNVAHTVNSERTRLDLVARVRRLIQYRELVVNLVRREIRGRYKESALGFAWSMLTPLLYLAVFYFVFNIFLPGGIPFFPIYLLSGLLPWTLFSSSLGGSASSLVANSALLKKVSFPREVLPFASIGAAFFHFCLQMLMLLAVMVIFRYPFAGKYLLLAPLAIAIEILLLAGLGLLLSSLTVYLRDLQHLLDIALLAWFWMTPIVYPIALVYERSAPRGLFGFYLLNPLTPIVLAMQRALYNKVTPVVDGTPVSVLLDEPMSFYIERLAWVGLVGVVLLIVGQIVFAKLEGDFATEL